MDVSNCKECRTALKAALLKGLDPSKLKVVGGHLKGCPALSPKPAPPTPEEGSKDETYPWSEQNYKIVPSPRFPTIDAAQGGIAGSGLPGDRSTPHVTPHGADRSTQSRPVHPAGRRQRSNRRQESGRRSGVPDSGYAQAERPRIQQFKVVNHANQGEKRDHLKGIWFVVFALGLVLSGIFAPPLSLVFAGAIGALFLIR